MFAGITDEDAAKVVDGLAPKAADRKDSIEQVKKLYELFRKTDCTMLEVSTLSLSCLLYTSSISFTEPLLSSVRSTLSLRHPLINW